MMELRWEGWMVVRLSRGDINPPDEADVLLSEISSQAATSTRMTSSTPRHFSLSVMVQHGPRQFLSCSSSPLSESLTLHAIQHVRNRTLAHALPTLTLRLALHTAVACTDFAGWGARRSSKAEQRQSSRSLFSQARHHAPGSTFQGGRELRDFRLGATVPRGYLVWSTVSGRSTVKPLPSQQMTMVSLCHCALCCQLSNLTQPHAEPSSSLHWYEHGNDTKGGIKITGGTCKNDNNVEERSRIKRSTSITPKNC